jgi:hypothetical protein
MFIIYGYILYTIRIFIEYLFINTIDFHILTNTFVLCHIYAKLPLWENFAPLPSLKICKILIPYFISYKKPIFISYKKPIFISYKKFLRRKKFVRYLFENLYLTKNLLNPPFLYLTKNFPGGIEFISYKKHSWEFRFPKKFCTLYIGKKISEKNS